MKGLGQGVQSFKKGMNEPVAEEKEKEEEGEPASSEETSQKEGNRSNEKAEWRAAYLRRTLEIMGTGFWMNSLNSLQTTEVNPRSRTENFWGS